MQGMGVSTIWYTINLAPYTRPKSLFLVPKPPFPSRQVFLYTLPCPHPGLHPRPGATTPHTIPGLQTRYTCVHPTTHSPPSWSLTTPRPGGLPGSTSAEPVPGSPPGRGYQDRSHTRASRACHRPTRFGLIMAPPRARLIGLIAWMVAYNHQLRSHPGASPHYPSTIAYAFTIQAQASSHPCLFMFTHQ
jgi:hypothetical protein